MYPVYATAYLTSSTTMSGPSINTIHTRDNRGNKFVKKKGD